jgi:NAD(P) transhydrogenase subunit alpha
MDILSSTATIAGYQAVLEAAAHLPKIFPMLMTAAGTLAPAKAFVVGVGVAGLQAIATAKRLGAVVEAYDVRPAVKDQVTSVGAKFVEFDLETEASEDAGGYAKEQSDDFLRRQREQMAEVVARNDVVITTAAIPGKASPVLVTEDMVEGMAPGSVIVDLAAERGGNCELTVSGETVERHGVTIVGELDLVSRKPNHASQMYSKNVETYLKSMIVDGELTLDLEDEVVDETLLCRDGAVHNPRVRGLLGLDADKGGE